MELKYGDILKMWNPQLGFTVYMVIEPPVECEHCGKVLYGWSIDETGELHCPACDGQIIKFQPAVCPYCGEHDLVTLVVASNNNFHVGEDGIIPYNHMVNTTNTFCGKSVARDIQEQRLHLCTPVEACMCKRNILWTSQDDYDENKEMPQWIKDRFPMP